MHAFLLFSVLPSSVLYSFFFSASFLLSSVSPSFLHSSLTSGLFPLSFTYFIPFFLYPDHFFLILPSLPSFLRQKQYGLGILHLASSSFLPSSRTRACYFWHNLLLPFVTMWFGKEEETCVTSILGVLLRLYQQIQKEEKTALQCHRRTPKSKKTRGADLYTTSSAAFPYDITRS